MVNHNLTLYSTKFTQKVGIKITYNILVIIGIPFFISRPVQGRSLLLSINYNGVSSKPEAGLQNANVIME